MTHSADLVAELQAAAYKLVLLQEQCAAARTCLADGAPMAQPDLATLRQTLEAEKRKRADAQAAAAAKQRELDALKAQSRHAMQCYAELLDMRDRLLVLAAETEDAKSREVASSLAPFACMLSCLGDEHPIDDAYHLSCCKRKICRDCASQYANSEMGEGRLPVRCPFKHEQCQGVMEEQDLRMVLDDKAFGVLCRLQWQKVRESEGMVFCRAADCACIVLRMDLGEPGTDSTTKDHFVCTLNREHQWCLQCDIIWHKDVTCAQYQEWKAKNANADNEMERLVKQMGWKKCPGCGNACERIAGCNAMKCRCGAAFCNLCNYHAPGGDAHPHFNEPGPCHGKVWP